MVHDPSTAAYAGSLTPQLEGAARSIPHPARVQEVKLSGELKKGGAQHE